MRKEGLLARVLAARPSALARLHDPAPHARLLGNGTYSVLVTGAGSGASRYGDRLLTAWSGDRTEDGDGFFVYLRDRDDGRFWSVGAQPVAGRPDEVQATSTPACVRLARREQDVEALLEVCVAAHADLEVRRLHLRNLGRSRRRLEVTTYAEVVLHHAAAHAAHPAFQKLFVQTEHVTAGDLLVARRRPRGADERHPWLLHAVVGGEPGERQHETDRARFVGRGRTLTAPRALDRGRVLSGTVGSVLDPVLSLRRTVVLEPGAAATLHSVLAAAPERDALVALAARELSAASLDDAFAAAARSEAELRARLGVDDAAAEALQDLAAGMLYGDPALRAPEEVLRRASGSQASLAAHGIARDAPFVVLRLARAEDVADLRDLLVAQRYWLALGFAAEVVALCTGGDDLAAAAHAEIEATAATPAGHGGTPAVRVVREDALARDGSVDAVLAAARLVLPHAARAAAPAASVRAHPAVPADHGGAGDVAAPPGDDLLMFNGIGGFAPSGEEYVLRLPAGERPPMPWVNVLANEGFGFLASESGAANTWSRNSRENRLTPWRNDPVCDPHDEALYLRDEDAGVFWSPLPGPVPAHVPCEVRHGLGFSSWRQTAQSLEQETTAFVPRAAGVKIQRLRVTNPGGAARHLSAFSYQRLVLGGLPGEGGRFVTTAHDRETGAVLARNRLNDEFAGGVAFAAAFVHGGSAVATHHGCDRTAFLGRNGSPAGPAALRHATTLDGTTGAGYDPCAALQATFELAPRASVEVVFLLGEAESEDAARALVRRYASPGAVEAALDEVRGFWRDLAGTLRVETPSPALDVMLGGWLLYQTLACRMWGRTAFYQSGGAFGFRDQLQDAGAFLLGRPALTRAQLLLHAAHQFVEGDVLHWWHPPIARGIRTRFADDLCWLAFLTATYVHATGDAGVLDERVGFVRARELQPGEDEAYLVPQRAAEEADLYEHCCRALDRSLTRGPHGLPLFGTGDWNDGMNRVGREGRGESVWMAFFLYRILEDFVPLCERRGDAARVATYRAYQRELSRNLEQHAWDGAWYRRAWYDDGATLGSAADLECRIDALAQAWAALSGAVPRERAERAVDSALEHLLEEEAGLIRLLAPPFDRDPHDPGYIKGYVPGIRENGGQYTHAALWVVEAVARLGRHERAVSLLEMLLPVSHARTPADVGVYQVEPYVVAADVYGVAPHLGRGGWTWYTGSAGWMYRIAVEAILGLSLEGGDTLRIAPCVPDTWTRYALHLDLDGGRSRYAIEVVIPRGSAARVVAASVDGAAAPVEDGAARIAIARDRTLHRVRVELGA